MGLSQLVSKVISTLSGQKKVVLSIVTLVASLEFLSPMIR